MTIAGDPRPRWRALRANLAAAVILAALLTTIAVALSSNAGPHLDQGAVHYLGGADPSFARYTNNRDRSYGAFLRRHMWRMVVYSPYFDNKTRWFPNAWVYDDAYAIYRGSPLPKQHPEWILRDASGSPLYIPFACSNGTCPQYAADISNRAFRRHWIAGARAELLHGYRGLFVDDVNMEFRVGDGQGHQVAPLEPATHQPMTDEAWRGYMAQFMEQIRAAFPHTEIVHNAIWFAGSPAGKAERDIQREIRAADYINLERGVNDPGLTGGSGPFSLTSFLAYIDAVHALGKGVVLDGNVTDGRGIEYALASYFLISAGNDLVSTGGMTPTHWWTGFDANLGDAIGARKQWQGLLRRDFTSGIALVNEPGSLPHTVNLPTAMRDLNGRIVKSLTIPPAGGVVLKSS